MKEQKPIGEVTHFYGHLGVAIVKFNKVVTVGTTLRFKGATTDFEETVGSMQYDHKSVEGAKKGQEVGLKVKQKAREGDLVFQV
ncbi:MAG: translation elongation factor-like protein [Candidatus Liptonbacteria bacterium]|nr:translation elongation factor-like protein [Candidatus Liptonbacteria bacterium]